MNFRMSWIPVLWVIAVVPLFGDGEVLPIPLPRVTGTITIDGDVSDPGWSESAKVDRFFETSPADNTPAKVTTIAWIAYDDRYLYLAFDAKDPDPKKIRAPFVDRDNVFGTDDNIAVFLDTRNDGRTAMEFRVNPRGIQGDAMYNDATFNEDFSPDFFYDTAARLNPDGWTAEMRIPLTTLRYPKTEPQTWRILIWRNYPRDFRYQLHSAPIPRGRNCLVCNSHELTGITGLPTSNHLVVAPFATAQQSEHRDLSQAGSDLESDPFKSDVGLDVKWNPSADSAIDATLNPDFSQIEADVAQISVNERFALFFPEKRPFFLEGIDLFESPIPAVYTRNITSPRWGLRGTGKVGASAYTLLVSQDRGGGSVIIPGAFGSDFAPQEFSSTVALGRLRRDFGQSYGGLIFTDREIEDGGYNRLFGPDFQWRRDDSNTVTGQLLYSSTEDPQRPDLYPGFTGDRTEGHAATLWWAHQTRTLDWFVEADDYADEFRADTGFVPQVGYRAFYSNIAYKFWPKEGLFRMIRPFVNANVSWDTEGEPLLRSIYPGINANGKRNLQLNASLRVDEEIGTETGVLSQSYATYFVQFDPSRRLPRIGINGRIGESIDFANSRVGDGGTVGLSATVRPTDHLELLISSTRQWLDVETPLADGRLFTAGVERIKATYVFSAKSLLRVIGQYVKTERDPDLYDFRVSKQSGGFLGSILYSYKLNWQTVLFVGYGDNQILTEDNDLLTSDRTLFMKLSYAYQR